MSKDFKKEYLTIVLNMQGLLRRCYELQDGPNADYYGGMSQYMHTKNITLLPEAPRGTEVSGISISNGVVKVIVEFHDYEYSSTERLSFQELEGRYDDVVKKIAEAQARDKNQTKLDLELEAVARKEKYEELKREFESND